MSETHTDLATQHQADANSPGLLKAVAELGQRRRVVTSRAIFNDQGIKLLEGGVQIDASLYDRLVSHRLSAPLDESMTTESAVDSASLREAFEAALTRWPFFALMAPPGRVRSMLLQAIDGIPLPEPVAFQLTLARDTRPQQFEHAILMAILCAHLEREGGAPIHDITVAATAGLLHDLGMLHIDATLLEAGNRLDGDARRPLYVHPVTGSMLVERFHDYPRQVARAILEHHERLDGSGYPRGLVGGAISPLGRLLSLCEVVTGMFDGRRERPEERVSLLLRVSPQRFDQNLVPSIHRLLRALPPTEAVVESTVAESALRLRMLADLLGQWHAAAAASTGLAAPAQAVVRAMAEQAVNLQRMLLQAGISTEQLEMLGPEDETDNTLRAELQALSRELGWHLRASANQLRRRWRGVAEATRFPPAIASWLDAVEALDAAA